MPKYLIPATEYVYREYVVEAVNVDDAISAMNNDRFIRVPSPPYKRTRRQKVDFVGPALREKRRTKSPPKLTGSFD